MINIYNLHYININVIYNNYKFEYPLNRLFYLKMMLKCIENFQKVYLYQ